LYSVSIELHYSVIWSSGFHNVQQYGVKYHLYADDTQLYISLDPDNELNFSYSLKNLEHCIAAMDDSKSSKTK